MRVTPASEIALGFALPLINFDIEPMHFEQESSLSYDARALLNGAKRGYERAKKQQGKRPDAYKHSAKEYTDCILGIDFLGFFRSQYIGIDVTGDEDMIEEKVKKQKRRRLAFEEIGIEKLVILYWTPSDDWVVLSQSQKDAYLLKLTKILEDIVVMEDYIQVHHV